MSSNRPPAAPATFGEWLDDFIEVTEHNKSLVAERIRPGGDTEVIKSSGIMHTYYATQLDTLRAVRNAANNYGVETTTPKVKR